MPLVEKGLTDLPKGTPGTPRDDTPAYYMNLQRSYIAWFLILQCTKRMFISEAVKILILQNIYAHNFSDMCAAWNIKSIFVINYYYLVHVASCSPNYVQRRRKVRKYGGGELVIQDLETIWLHYENDKSLCFGVN